MWGTRLKSHRSLGRSNRFKFARGKFASAAPALDFLEGDKSMPRTDIEYAINRPRPVAQFRKTLLGLKHVRAWLKSMLLCAGNVAEVGCDDKL